MPIALAKGDSGEMPDLPVAPPRALRWQILGSLIVAVLHEWRRRPDLAYLDERILRDIGLDPERARPDRSDAGY